MKEEFSRTRLLFGEEKMKKLYEARVAIFGIGGVGGYVAEGLARSGVSHLVLVDSDRVSLSNLNRQIIATHATLGKYKVDVMRDRILDINPQAQVETFRCFYLPETAGWFDFRAYDYVVDAVDTVTAKLEIISRAKNSGTPVISSMGAGNKINPCLFRVLDIADTSMDPLAKVMRRECRKRGIERLKVVCSAEEPKRPLEETESSCTGNEDFSGLPVRGGRQKAVPGSTAFVPSVAGMMLAAEVVRDLISDDNCP